MADPKIADRELMRVEFRSLQARISVLEMRQKTVEEELEEMKRDLKHLFDSMEGFVHDND